MKRMILGLTTSLVSTGAIAAPMACDGLTAKALGLSGVRLTEVASVPAGEESPVNACRVRGVMAERTGMDGKPYALSFELNLPEDWNGDYVHQFNGGNDGEVKPATGGLKAGTGSDTPLGRGYAVVSSDAGHDGKANPDKGLAGGANFGFDFEARQMYGYKAVATLDPVARQAVQAFYGSDIDKSYGVGCSNGGRHAMVAASRMPEAFDGLLIGAPGFNLPKAALQHAHDVQNFMSINGALKTAFTPDDLKLVGNGVRAACDALDGLEDGLVQNTAACQDAFDVTTLQCTDGQNSECLTEAQVTVLQNIHAGPKGANGEQLYSDWAWDTGIEGGNWRFWKLESPIAPWGNRPIIGVMGSGSLAQIFTTPPTDVEGSPEALEQFLMDFDLQARAGDIYATTAEFPESAMEVMSPPGSDNPELAQFRDAGGKMLVFHGVSDAVFSVNDTANWYGKLDANNGGKAADFARFYPVPAMSHCSGGPATEDFDLFTALVDWVETGTAPEAIPASAREGNEELPESLKGSETVLCPAPQTAHYTGTDPKSASSFTCQ